MPPRSVPGPASMPRMRSTVTIQATSVAASNVATTSVLLRETVTRPAESISGAP